MPITISYLVDLNRPSAVAVPACAISLVSGNANGIKAAVRRHVSLRIRAWFRRYGDPRCDNRQGWVGDGKVLVNFASYWLWDTG